MDEETEHAIVVDALESVLWDIDRYQDSHYGHAPFREETIQKLRAALRLVSKEK